LAARGWRLLCGPAGARGWRPLRGAGARCAGLPVRGPAGARGWRPLRGPGLPLRGPGLPVCGPGLPVCGPGLPARVALGRPLRGSQGCGREFLSCPCSRMLTVRVSLIAFRNAGRT